VALFVSCV